MPSSYKKVLNKKLNILNNGVIVDVSITPKEHKVSHHHCTKSEVFY